MRREGDGNEPFEFEDAMIVAMTELAVKVRVDDGDAFWVPKSVIHDDSEIWELGDDGSPSDQGTFTVQAWWARQNNHA